MAEEILEEKTMGVDDYLKLFEAGSADYEMVKKRSENLSHIKIAVVRDKTGRKAEDTTFYEKTGVHYTIRQILD